MLEVQGCSGGRVRCATSSSSSFQESREINFWLCLINIAPDPGSGCGFVLLLVSSSIGDRFRFAFASVQSEVAQFGFRV